VQRRARVACAVVPSAKLPERAGAAAIQVQHVLRQLEARDHIQSTRQRIWDFYRANLEDWAEEQDVRLLIVPTHSEQAYHMFYLLMPNLAERQRLIAHLKERQIQAAFHYQPLHLSDVGRRLRQGTLFAIPKEQLTL